MEKIREILFQNNFENLGNFIKELDDENPNNQVVMGLMKSLNQIYFYSNGLQLENQELKMQLSQEKSFHNKAILKRKEMAIQNEDLRNQLKQLNNE